VVADIERRIWIRSGIVEELDARQRRMLEHVLEKIRFYYRELHGTRPCYQKPLSFKQLRKLCNRNSPSLQHALCVLANTVPYGSKEEPPIYYDRIMSGKNGSHRPYRIWIRIKE